MAVLLAYVARGAVGAQGMALGIIGTGTNFLALWMAVSLTGFNPSKDPSVRPEMVVRGLVLLASLPGILVCMRLSHALGSVADSCFLVGLGVVYSAMIWWGVLRTRLD